MKYFAKFLALFLAMILSLAVPTAALAGNGNGKVKPEQAQSQSATVPDDEDDNEHPSGKDKETNNGPTDDTQGKSPSEPDQNGSGPERDHEGTDKPGGPGGKDKDDQDGNNGCGNDDDFEDDNEGLCGGKPKPSKSAKPTESPKVKPSDKPSPKPTQTNKPEPTKGPVSPKPSVTASPVSDECPAGTAVGEFSNNSGNPATLTVKVNGAVTRFGLTSVQPTALPGVFTVHATDFEFPGVVHIAGLEPGDSVSLHITDGRTSDSQTGTVSENCYVGLNVSLAKFVGPVAPPVKPVVPVAPAPKPVVVPNKMGPHVPVQIPAQQVSDGHTVTIDELPYTGSGVKTAVIIGLVLLVGGFLLLRAGRLRR